MDQHNSVKNWVTASVFEYSCKNNVMPVIEKILRDQELSSNLHIAFVDNKSERQKVKPVFVLIQMLNRLLVSVETFASETSISCYPWNSEALPKIIKLLEKAYEQCEFISIKKFFSLLFQLKFLDLMHLLRTNVEPAVLMQKLNLHFPRQLKSTHERQFQIENSKVLDKVEESCNQCRRLILKLSTSPSYKQVYMKEQFSNDMKKMMIDSVILLKEVISNLSSNAGLTVIEKNISSDPASVNPDDLGYQVLLDYLQPQVTPEALLKLIDEIEPALEFPSGGFSSCLLPFDTLSECSETEKDSESYESDSEDNCDEEDDS